MKGIIFDTEEAAKDWDWQNNQLTGSVTRYRFARKALTQTTTLTKAEYAEVNGIPQQVYNEDEELVANPAYTYLDETYFVDKCALIVGDAFAEYDEDGNFTGHSENVVDISNLILVSEEL